MLERRYLEAGAILILGSWNNTSNTANSEISLGDNAKMFEIITPTNTPKNIYNFILKNLLHVSALLGHLLGE
jgi:hypothetical protein